MDTDPFGYFGPCQFKSLPLFPDDGDFHQSLDSDARHLLESSAFSSIDNPEEQSTVQSHAKLLETPRSQSPDCEIDSGLGLPSPMPPRSEVSALSDGQNLSDETSVISISPGRSIFNISDPDPPEADTEAWISHQILSGLPQPLGQPLQLRARSHISINNCEIEECMVSFPIDPPLPLQLSPKRKRFTPKRKEEVALVRKIGACLSCRLKKLACQPSGICDRCRRVGNSAGLSDTKHLCVRHSLLNVRFESFDWMHTPFRENFVRRELIWPFVAAKTKISVGFALELSNVLPADSMSGIPLEIQLQYYGVNNPEPLYDMAMIRNFFTPDGRPCLDSPIVNYEHFQCVRCAIPPDNLPTVEQLEVWGQAHMEAVAYRGTKDLANDFHIFLLRYCSVIPALPHYSIAKAALRVASLDECCAAIAYWPPEGATTHRYLPRTAATQIALVAKKGIAEAERLIFQFLEKLIYSGKGLGEDSPLVLWAILWCMMLTYRDTLDHDQSFKLCPYRDHDEFDNLIDSANMLYNMVVTIYSTFFRTSTPLQLDVEADAHLFGYNETLMNEFRFLRQQVIWFYNFAEYSSGIDGLFFKLIKDHEMKNFKLNAPEPAQDDVLIVKMERGTTC